MLYNDNIFFMILNAGVSGVNFGMLNVYPKHDRKLSFQFYFRFIGTVLRKKCYFYVNITCILFQVKKKLLHCYVPHKTEPRASSFNVFTQLNSIMAVIKILFNNMKALGNVTGIGSKFVHWVLSWPSNINIRTIHYIMDSL